MGLPLDIELQTLHKELAEVLDGTTATYIPPLADADPRRHGVEPTGDAFNSIAVDEASGRPFNPMVNAGAIVTASLVGGADRVERDERLLAGLGRFAGRPLDVDDDVFDAERRTGDRNRAIAYLMKTFGMLRDDVESAVETYFRQCSVLVDVRDLATMGATLANAGVNPLTGERAVTAEHVARLLSVMSSCGMYDFAGEWLYRVGLPAKSGVSGGVVAVLPGELAIASYSPPLDARGNSVRGIRACEWLARRFRLHVFDSHTPASVVRRATDGSAVRSTRRRTVDQLDQLARVGGSIRIVEVQGPLHFGSAEVLSRAAADLTVDASHLVVDATRVTAIDGGAWPVLEATVESIVDRGVEVLLCGPPVDRATWPEGTHQSECLDAALERCEDEILRRFGTDGDEQAVSLSDHELLDGFSDAHQAALGAAATTASYPAGTRIFAQGDAGDAVYLLLGGRVQITLDRPGAAPERITTIGPGSSFGEMAVLDRGPRSTNVDVEVEATCAVLDQAGIEHLERTHPDCLAALYRNLAATVSRRLRAANDELRALRA